MSLENDLVQYLLSQAAITALVKGNRIFCGPRDQKDGVPCINIWRQGSDHGHTLTTGSGWAKARLQIECRATNWLDGEAIKDQVRGEMQGLTGTIGTTSTNVSAGIIEGDSYQFEPPVFGDDVGLHNFISDYTVLYAESVPSIST